MDKEMYIVIAIIVIVVIVIISNINKIISLKNKVSRGKSVVDVHLKKRYDLIPNLVEVVKGYANYEQKTLEEIARLRNAFKDTSSEEAGSKLNEYYRSILAIVESYPNLKAQENFLQLQKTLVKVENEISAARRIYINDITRYNSLIEIFPMNIFAHMFGYKKIDIPNYESEDIKVKF